MARIRTIKPKFWDDQKIGRLPRDARLLYIGLWTFADDLGVVISDPVWLKSKIFPYDQIQIKQMEAWLEMLVKNGFICHVKIRTETFIYLPTFTRHQIINRPNLEDVNVPKELLDSALKGITEHSATNHGSINDESLPIVGEEMERENIPPIIPPRGTKSAENEGTVLPKSDKTPSASTPELRGTPSPGFAKFRKWIDENALRVAKMKEPFTEEQFETIKRDFGLDFICELLRAMHNHEPLLRKNRSAYLTFTNWAKRRQAETAPNKRSQHAITVLPENKQFKTF